MFDPSAPQNLTVGGEAGTTVNGAFSSSLTIQVRDGSSLNAYNVMHGTGSLLIERIGSLSSDSVVALRSNGGSSFGASTFTGGVTLNSGYLDLQESSETSGGSVVAGPLGTGTFTVAGGKVIATTGLAFIHNHLKLNADLISDDGGTL